VATETDLEVSNGRRLHIYDTGADDAGARLTIFWHHGTPNIGAARTPTPGRLPARYPLGVV
jgi:hypothetical protein